MSRQCRLPPQMCFSLSGAGWTFSGTQVPRCLAFYINFFFFFFWTTYKVMGFIMSLIAVCYCTLLIYTPKLALSPCK